MTQTRAAEWYNTQIQHSTLEMGVNITSWVHNVIYSCQRTFANHQAGVFSGHCEILECLLTALVWRCAECEGCHYPAQLWTLTIASHSSSEWRECGLNNWWSLDTGQPDHMDHDRLFIGHRQSSGEHWLYRVKSPGKCRFSQDCGS